LAARPEVSRDMFEVLGKALAQDRV
jgi:hypothetical protein